MPSRIARAPACSASMMIVMTRPKTVTASGTPIGTVPSSTRPTGVPPLTLTMPPSTRPMNRMKKPMPTTIAFLSSSGIALKIASRKPVSTRIGDGDAFEDDEAHGALEGEALAEDEAEGDDRVEAHAGGDGVGAVGDQTHEDGHHAGDEAGRRERGGERQALWAPPRPRMLGFTKMM